MEMDQSFTIDPFFCFRFLKSLVITVLRAKLIKIITGANFNQLEKNARFILL